LQQTPSAQNIEMHFELLMQGTVQVTQEQAQNGSKI